MPKPKANAPANSNPLPPVPPGAIRMAKIGGTIALVAAAAMSAQTLVALGHILGYHGKIAWLLPASLDVYAGTSIWVGYRIPAAHPASVIARRDAVLALTLTVCCNALYHLLLLAGSALPKPLIDTLLVLVGALPPLVVERIFHLQMSVRNGDGNAAPADAAPAPTAATPGTGIQTAPASKTATPAPAPALPAAPVQTAPAPKPMPNPGIVPTTNGISAGTRPGTAKSGTGTGGRRSPEEWAKLALPLWHRYVDKHSEPPTAPVLANMLRNAHPDLPTGDSERWERNVRAATKDLVDRGDTSDDDSEPAGAVIS